MQPMIIQLDFREDKQHVKGPTENGPATLE